MRNMKAWLLDDFNGLDALRLDGSVPVPSPGPGQVLVRVRYASLNPADRFLAERLYPARPKLPHILGRDGCGVVEEVGEAVKDSQVGEEVIVLRGDAGVELPGAFAQYVVVPADCVAPAPKEWKPAEAAAAPLVYLTAYQALHQWGPLERGTVGITGVSGGVGLASLHLAKAAGHRIIGFSRGSDKVDRLVSLGCDHVLDPSQADIVATIKRITDRHGVDLVVDNIAGPLFSTLLDAMAYGGRISAVGMLAGPVPQFNTAKLLFRRVRIGGVLVSDYGKDDARSVWARVVETMDRLRARPVVDSVYPMEQLKEAFARLAQGPLGKVLLRVAD